MADDEKDNPDDRSDVYQISGLSAPAETLVTPSVNQDIFAVKEENTDRLGAIIGMALSEGVFLCNAYRLDKRISRDEMGEVWQAADLQKSRNVVLYLPPPEIRKDERSIEPVRQNAKHVEALEHPRIVPVWENFIDPEHGFFVVLKLVPGKTLDLYWQEYVRQYKKPAPVKVVKMLGDIAHALDYVHGADIVHGDLCPKNITVGLDGEVYLDNFALLPGAALLPAGAENISMTRKPYLPPEVLEGHPPTVASDIYALAVIAYELFSGGLPCQAEHGMPLPIPGVPSSVDAVIRKAMTKDPDDRYDSCGAFLKMLEAGFREPTTMKAPVMKPLKGKPTAIKPVPGAMPPKRKPASSASLRAMMLLLGFLLGGTAACFVYDVGGLRSHYFAPPVLEPTPELILEPPAEAKEELCEPCG